MAASPTKDDLAASIGCQPGDIIRSVYNPKTDRYVSFVRPPDGDEAKADVFETRWPQ